MAEFPVLSFFPRFSLLVFLSRFLFVFCSKSLGVSSFAFFAVGIFKAMLWHACACIVDGAIVSACVDLSHTLLPTCAPKRVKGGGGELEGRK